MTSIRPILPTLEDVFIERLGGTRLEGHGGQRGSRRQDKICGAEARLWGLRAGAAPARRADGAGH